MTPPSRPSLDEPWWRVVERVQSMQPPVPPEQAGEWLRAWARGHGTQREAAELLGVPPATFLGYLAGRAPTPFVWGLLWRSAVLWDMTRAAPDRPREK